MFGKENVKEKISNIDFIIKLFILVLFGIGVFILYKIGTILILLSFAIFLNMLFAPFLNKMNKYKIKDGVGIIIIYFIIFLFIFIVFFAILPIFIKQLLSLINFVSDIVNSYVEIYKNSGIKGFGLPIFIEGYLINLDLTEVLNSLKNNISSISSFAGKNLQNFLTSGAGFFISLTNAFVSFILVFIFSFFIAIERKDIRNFFYKILPEKTSNYILKKEKSIIETLYNWLKGQMILGVSIFFITLFGLLFIRLFGVNIEDYFTLALIAGMMEFVPYVGPIIALLPALAIALGISYKAVIIILILYIIIQQVENNVLVPYVMGKTLSLSPFSVLIAMTIGATLFGIVGIIIAIPLVSIIQLFLSDYLKDKKNIIK